MLKLNDGNVLGMLRYGILVGLCTLFLSLPTWADYYSNEAVRIKAVALFKKKDYAGLDALAEETLAKGFEMANKIPDITGFYEAFDLSSSAKDEVWLNREKELRAWIAQRPDSVFARIALADWFVEYARHARESGYADAVTNKGWVPKRERLAEAAATLQQIPIHDLKDPTYYNVWLRVAQEQGWSIEAMQGTFEKGVAIGDGYYPIYRNAAHYLWPQWYGAPSLATRLGGGIADLLGIELKERSNPWGKFIQNVADRHPGEKGDLLYANLAFRRYVADDEQQKVANMLDLDRLKRGVAYQAEAAPADVLKSQNQLCHIAMLRGDLATAKALFLAMKYGDISLFGTRDTFEAMRKKSRAQAEIDVARALEREGKLPEAEAKYASFAAPGERNGWLEGYYLAYGMKEKYEALPKVEGYPADLTNVDLNRIKFIGEELALFADWEHAAAAATIFDAKRGHNLSGRWVLFLCAAEKGDTEAVAALKKKTIEFKVDRPAYKRLQRVLKEETTWEATSQEFFKEDDAYNIQAVITLIACYVAEGKLELAAKVRDEMRAAHRDDDIYSDALDGMQHGRLAQFWKK